MGFYADSWLREARERIKSCQNQSSDANTLNVSDFESLADGVEKAIKAALIENSGSVPEQYNHHQLVSICQTTGVWDILPPSLKHFVQEIESFQLAMRNSTNPPLAVSDPIEQWGKYLSTAPRLIDYMEHHVIGNDSVLKRLTLS